MSTVRDLVEHASRVRGDAVYAVGTESGESLTYADLARSTHLVRALLDELGIAPGSTVSLVMGNGLTTLRLLLGAMAGGYTVNPVNLLSQPEQMRHVLAHSDCSVVFAAPEWEDKVRAIVDAIPRDIALHVVDPDAHRLPGEASLAARMPAAATDDRPPRPPTADAPVATAPLRVEANEAVPEPGDVALLMYTSGTTGLPKGVMLTQANLVANARAIAAEHALTADDRVLAVLPLYHINAFAVTMLAPLASGGSLAMPPRFSAARFWQQTAEQRCTWINVVPTIVSYLLEGETPPPETTRAIRFCRSASAALPPEHHRAFEAKFGIGIIETMGLTETVAPAFSNPLDPARRQIGSVGLASGCEARVVDASFVPVADGVTGEITIRGPNVMLGYYKDEAATRAAFTPDGQWLRTGDLGHRDLEGYFHVTGRIKELIIKGGENIAPREIDEALLAHPAILEAAAVGIPDRHYGQEIMACIVLKPGERLGEEELREFCIERLGRYKTPKVLRFVNELPRGPSGKVQRLKLLDGLGPA